MDRIEDKIFADALEAKGMKRTKSMYIRDCKHPHQCRFCLERIDEPRDIYRLKPEFVLGGETPFSFICSDCFDELPND